MIQNVVLTSVSSIGSDKLVIAANNVSEFVKWMQRRFEQPQELTAHIALGAINQYDKLEHEGVVSRSMIQEWLWSNRGTLVTCELA